jgi:hypothetical protein
MKFKSIWIATLILFCAAFTSAQHLPNLPSKPAMQFESPSFCPPEGNTSNHGDPELNKHKNRIDKAANYFPVNFTEIESLAYPASAGGKIRSDWTASERNQIEKFEGIPIVVQGFLALVNNAKPGEPKKIEGARPEGKESCNCNSEQPNQIDFHIWLLNVAGDDRKNAVVVEMTPRVRAHHPNWTVANLTHIANMKFPVRIYGWLMFDGQHPEQVGGTRATLWEIHPIIKLQFKQGNQWKTL